MESQVHHHVFPNHEVVTQIYCLALFLFCLVSKLFNWMESQPIFSLQVYILKEKLPMKLLLSQKTSVTQFWVGNQQLRNAALKSGKNSNHHTTLPETGKDVWDVMEYHSVRREGTTRGASTWRILEKPMVGVTSQGNLQGAPLSVMNYITTLLYKRLLWRRSVSAEAAM